MERKQIVIRDAFSNEEIARIGEPEHPALWELHNQCMAINATIEALRASGHLGTDLYSAVISVPD